MLGKETVHDELRYGINPDQIVAYGAAGARQRVVIMDAIVARTLRRGHAVIWNGVIEPGGADAGNVPIARSSTAATETV